jgi:hypothetical protein
MPFGAAFPELESLTTGEWWKRGAQAPTLSSATPRRTTTDTASPKPATTTLSMSPIGGSSQLGVEGQYTLQWFNPRDGSKSCISSSGDALAALYRTATPNASNIQVKGECLPAHGTSMVLTPQRAHWQRGTRARSSVSNCMVSRCRHFLSGA